MIQNLFTHSPPIISHGVYPPFTRVRVFPSRELGPHILPRGRVFSSRELGTHISPGGRVFASRELGTHISPGGRVFASRELGTHISPKGRVFVLRSVRPRLLHAKIYFLSFFLLDIRICKGMGICFEVGKKRVYHKIILYFISHAHLVEGQWVLRSMRGVYMQKSSNVFSRHSHFILAMVFVSRK